MKTRCMRTTLEWLAALTVFALVMGGMCTMVWGQDEAPKSICPTTRMAKECLECHVKGNFAVRETAPDAARVYPTKSMSIVEPAQGPSYGYYLLQEVAADEIRAFFSYLDRHDIGLAVIEVHSPGGSLFQAQRIIGMMETWQARGNLIETRIYGTAMSAGFQIFVAGNRRLVVPSALLMWHEIQSVKFFFGIGITVETPSDKEEEARVLRFLQDSRNAWLASRSRMSKEELDDKVRRKEFWVDGRKAVEYGFADGFLQDMK